jgi:hypothetical protein
MVEDSRKTKIRNITLHTGYSGESFRNAGMPKCQYVCVARISKNQKTRCVTTPLTDDSYQSDQLILLGISTV